MKDPFLKKGASFNRLKEDFVKHGSLVIGYDFDCTVHDFHKEGHKYPKVKKLLRDLKDIGCKVICWTSYKDLAYVEKYLKDNGIPFDSINGNGVDLGYESKKPFFSTVLDDRVGLRQVYKELTKIVKYAKILKNGRTESAASTH